METIKIIFKGIERTLQYDFQYIDCHYDGFYRTNFFEGTETITERKFWLFGPKITKEQPKMIFKLDLDIRDINYTKKEIKNKIQRKLELLERGAEIERGEII